MGCWSPLAGVPLLPHESVRWWRGSSALFMCAFTVGSFAECKETTSTLLHLRPFDAE